MSPEERLELIALLAQDAGWRSLLTVGRMLLDNAYPEHIFNGSSGDSGPQYIVALREALRRIDELEANDAIGQR
jgi:hypothetical protein